MNHINKVTFCCYEVEPTEEDSENISPQVDSQSRQDSLPMLTMGTNSNIKFSSINKKNDQPIHELLLKLYENRDKKGQSDKIFSLLSKKRINPNFNWIEEGERDDLEYYIPQLVTYMVIEENLDNLNLIQIILNACTTDFYFAHSVYFYLHSFSSNWMEEPIKGVIDFIEQKFLPSMKIYCKNRLSGIEFTKGMLSNDPQLRDFKFESENQRIQHLQSQEGEFKLYGTKDYPSPPPDYPTAIENQCILKKEYCSEGFMETPTFWSDLVSIGEDISSVPNNERNEMLDHLIKTRVNTKLPASVYVPFFKEKIRMYTVLCVWKGRLFSTKERAPFSIWVELYREEEELEILQEVVEKQLQPLMHEKKDKKGKFLEKIYNTLSKPLNIAQNANTLNIKKYFKDKFNPSLSEQESEGSLKRKKSIKPNRPRFSSSVYEETSPVKSRKSDRRKFSISFVYERSFSEDEGSSNSKGSSSIESDRKSKQGLFDGDVYQKQLTDDFFPPKSTDAIQQFRKRSIYRDLKSWRIVHLMVKTGDDLKQEQFAMQLINNFDGIFKKEMPGCIVFPYEVISLGPNYGLIEMLQDVTTLDGLFKNLGPRKLSLKDFFSSYFKDRLPEAKSNFVRSLAGYCLVTYFLQVKDRHNGNILLHRDGYIMHIDFGFFLSNSPGKGVELEKNVPFKLLTQYVEVIGSLNSESFFEFRRLFYKGFQAIVRHRQSIISLVKMMYSSHGQSMGCFIKSEEAVISLEKRLNPPQNLEEFCYDLINSSLDNWRSKWYDKFQYFLQKIYY